MSLKSRFLRSVALPAVLAFGAVSAPALAAEGQPIAPKTCYTSDANGPANEKLSAAMRARDQKIIITANRAFPMKDAKGNPLFRTGYNEEIFTSNLDGSEGYSIASDVPSGQVGTKYCIGPMHTNVNLYNAYQSADIPSEIRKGRFGKMFSKAHTKGFNVMMTAQTSGGSLIAVGMIPSSPEKFGGMTIADANGNNPEAAADYSSVNYSPMAKKSLGIKDADLLATYRPQ